MVLILKGLIRPSMLWYNGELMRENVSRAVAVTYSPDFPAPIVVAKGERNAAERLVAIAKEYGIDIREDEKLADGLFILDIGSMIPEEFYEIMAEILSFVYFTRSKRDE